MRTRAGTPWNRTEQDSFILVHNTLFYNRRTVRACEKRKEYIKTESEGMIIRASNKSRSA
jgi:hypothetical protein